MSNFIYVKGKAGVPITQAFAKAFPLTDNPLNPTLLTVQRFDQWASANNCYSLHQEPDTINGYRNRLRYKINNTACSKAWKLAGMTPFHVQVKNHGVDYIVISAEAAMKTKAKRLPSQIQSLGQTKLGALKQLRASVDFKKLPVANQFEIEQFEEGCEEFFDDVVTLVERRQAKFARIQSKLKELLDSGALAITNGGLQTFLAVDGDSEPTDDDGED